MKFDSPLFDRIKVKPSKDRRLKTGGPNCEWVGCKEKAAHKAPKGRGREKDYWHFCIDHVRAYNASYNYFTGMSDDEVLAYQKDALTGHRPTWKMGTGKGGKPDFDATTDPLGVLNDINGRAGSRPDPDHKPQQRIVRNVERKALETMGLEAGATTAEVKARFKFLVKRHHPDANGGDRSSEDRLVEIIQAYNYLKTNGFD
jgi:DnaJ-like protein